MLFVMLTGTYPFDREEDKNDRGQMGRIIKRIMAVDYVIPPSLSLSPECVDIIHKILDPSPTKRLNTEGIMAHPWFNTDLPEGMKELNERVRAEQSSSQSGQTTADLIKVVEAARSDGNKPKARDGLDIYEDNMFDAWVCGVAKASTTGN
jgi:serine/threonine protein kinase